MAADEECALLGDRDDEAGRRSQGPRWSGQEAERRVVRAPAAARRCLGLAVVASAAGVAAFLGLAAEPLWRGDPGARDSEALAEALAELSELRPTAAKAAEAARRLNAEQGERPLLTLNNVKSCTNHHGDSLLEGHFCERSSGLFDNMEGSWNRWTDLGRILSDLRHQPATLGAEGVAWLMQKSFGVLFRLLNFVQGFRQPGWFNQVRYFFMWLFGISDPKWKPPVKGEKMGILTYEDYAKKHFGKPFGYDFFSQYYTGGSIPSWEDQGNHLKAMFLIDTGMGLARKAGIEPMDSMRPLEPRFALDNEALISVGWSGFEPMGPHDIKYASNGVFGVALVERLMERYGAEGGEVLGLLMTDSVFSVHLRHDGRRFYVDMTALAKYRPLPGYAPLGGKAAFEERNGTLHMVYLQYNDTNYTDFTDKNVTLDYHQRSRRSGWRMAEAALISSLLSMTNLVLHVKDLHLELAAAFQAVTVDAFAEDPKHPLRRALDPFISRSVQATNDNFKLLFDYKAAEFSLAPLPVDEQMRLIGDFMKEQPLDLAELDLEEFGRIRNMSGAFSTRETMDDPKRWGWRWHYRALSVQRLYDELLDCQLSRHYATAAALEQDKLLQGWWRSMVEHLPSLKRATLQHPKWVSGASLDFGSLKRVLRVLLVWLSWIHEDVGHSAASYVYNPVHTPMCVPEDGVGVPLRSYVFNVAAYRGFVFLERAALLDEPPSFWFEDEVCSGFWWFRRCWAPKESKDLQCFTKFQDKLKGMGQEDRAFAECNTQGFYSCVDRVETAVSS